MQNLNAVEILENEILKNEEKFSDSIKNYQKIQSAKIQAKKEEIDALLTLIKDTIMEIEAKREDLIHQGVWATEEGKRVNEILKSLYLFPQTTENKTPYTVVKLANERTVTVKELETLYILLLDNISKLTEQDLFYEASLPGTKFIYEKQTDQEKILDETFRKKLLVIFNEARNQAEEVSKLRKRREEIAKIVGDTAPEAQKQKSELLKILEKTFDDESYLKIPELASYVTEFVKMYRQLKEIDASENLQKEIIKEQSLNHQLGKLLVDRYMKIVTRVQKDLQQMYETQMKGDIEDKSEKRNIFIEKLQNLRDVQQKFEKAMVEKTFMISENISRLHKIFYEAQNRLQTLKAQYYKRYQRIISQLPSFDMSDFEEKVVEYLVSKGINPMDANDFVETDFSKCLTDDDEASKKVSSYSCVSDPHLFFKGTPVKLKEYQKAVVSLVSNPKLNTPGLLVMWDTGTGKTIAAAATIVETLKNPERESGQAMVLGFSISNLFMFYCDIKRYLGDSYDAITAKLIGNQFSDTGSEHTEFLFRVNNLQCSVIFIRMHLSPESHFKKSRVDSKGLLVVDEVHFVIRGPPPKGKTVTVNQNTLQQWQKFITDHDGKKLLLSATPVGKEGDPNGVLQVLKLLKRNQDVDANKWFDTKGNWVSECARQEFYNNWVKGLVSYVSLRFDQSVYPAVLTTCEGGDPNKPCAWKFNIKDLSFTLDQTREYTPEELEIRESRDYTNLVPSVIMVPQSHKAAESLRKRTREQPGLISCMVNDPKEEKEKEKCADHAKGFEKGSFHGYKFSSGGGYDYDVKGLALRAQIDAHYLAKKKHLVIATLNPRIPVNYYQESVLEPLQNKTSFNNKPLVSINASTFPKSLNIEEWFRQIGVQRRFISTLGNVVTTEQDSLSQRIFNHPLNSDGRYVEVLIVEGKRLTGLDVPGAHCMHFLSPPQDKTSQKQAYGRILRQCALANYAKTTGIKDPYVRVFTYVSFPDKTGRESFKVTPDELVINWLSKEKGNYSLSPVERLLEEMKEGAVDRDFFGSYSLGSKRKKETRITPMDFFDDIIWYELQGNEEDIDFELIDNITDIKSVEELYKTLRSELVRSKDVPNLEELQNYLVNMEDDRYTRLQNFMYKKYQVTDAETKNTNRNRTLLVNSLWNQYKETYTSGLEYNDSLVISSQILKNEPQDSLEA